MWLSNQEVVDPVMFVIADHQQRLADQRMKRIGDSGFECQKPGTMAPARMSEEKHGLSLGQSPPPVAKRVSVLSSLSTGN